MLSAELAMEDPLTLSGSITSVGGYPVHLFNDKHFAKARSSLKIKPNFLNGFDFGDLDKTGGKSGEVLAFTADKRYIVKSIHGREHETLLDITEVLCNHLDQDDKLLCSFLLHFEIRTGPAAGCYFVMNNCLPVLPDSMRWTRTMDLKGCIDDKTMVADGKKVKQVHRQDGCCWFGCDIEWSCCNTPERIAYVKGKRVARDIKFVVSPEDKRYITKAIASDVDFLQNTIQTMDYSLMIGILECSKDQTPNLPKTHYPNQPFLTHHRDSVTAYYFGIIDYLTVWSAKKKLAHIIKCLCAPKPIATVNPTAYGIRFEEYFQDKFVALRVRRVHVLAADIFAVLPGRVRFPSQHVALFSPCSNM